MKKTILSIIIPYYNTEQYMNDLLVCLDKQMMPGVEVLIVDDGSKVPFSTEYPWAKVFRKESFRERYSVAQWRGVNIEKI